MAKIVSENIVITLSRISKEGQDLSSLTTSEMKQTIEQIVQELVGDGVVVEVEVA